MNFFAHACFALRRRGDPGFVLGAMLPDLAPMAGLKLKAVHDDALAAGRRFHVTCDSAFHAVPHFTELVVASSRALQEAGVRRGPARGAAHVGLELLLDGWIAGSRGVPQGYRAALAAAPAFAQRIEFEARPDALSFEGLCGKIAASELPAAYADPGFTSARVARVLARRPRLALSDLERIHVERWAIAFAPELAGRAEDLLAQVDGAVDEALGERGH